MWGRLHTLPLPDSSRRCTAWIADEHVLLLPDDTHVQERTLSISYSTLLHMAFIT